MVSIQGKHSRFVNRFGARLSKLRATKTIRRRVGAPPMERDTTMPSILGPDSGYDRTSRAAREKPEAPQVSPVIKVVLWASVGALLFGAYRFFTR